MTTHELSRWLRTISYETMRGVESPQSALRPDGRRLRGIEVAPGLYLARDRQFYMTTPASPAHAVVATLEDVLARASFDAIRREVAAKLNAHSRRVLDRRAHRSRRRAS